MLLAPGVMALGASRLPSTYLLRLRRARLVVVPSVIALAVNIALNLLLIPVWGAAGCALASSLAYVLLAALQTRLFTRVTGIRGPELLPAAADSAHAPRRRASLRAGQAGCGLRAARIAALGLPICRGRSPGRRRVAIDSDANRD